MGLLSLAFGLFGFYAGFALISHSDEEYSCYYILLIMPLVKMVEELVAE